MIDSYIGDELLIETNHDVLHHLENCPACRQELAAHRNLRARLRSAVKDLSEMQIDPDFAANLQARLRKTARRPKWLAMFSGKASLFNSRMLPAAAAICLLMAAGFAGIWFKYRSSSPASASIAAPPSSSNVSIGNVPPSQSPITQAVQAAWREIADFAVGDHENCALEFRLTEKPITLDEAAQKYGKFNHDLDRAVIKPLKEIFPENTAEGIKFLEAHSCVYDGRRFAHIVLRRRNHIISVLVTAADLPGGKDEKIVSQSLNSLQIAGFRTNHYAVFVVSDLPAPENLAIAQAMTADVCRHIEKFEV